MFGQSLIKLHFLAVGGTADGVSTDEGRGYERRKKARLERFANGRHPQNTPREAEKARLLSSTRNVRNKLMASSSNSRWNTFRFEIKALVSLGTTLAVFRTEAQLKSERLPTFANNNRTNTCREALSRLIANSTTFTVRLVYTETRSNITCREAHSSNPRTLYIVHLWRSKKGRIRCLLKQSHQTFPSCTKMWERTDNKYRNYRNAIKLVKKERKSVSDFVVYFSFPTL